MYNSVVISSGHGRHVRGARDLIDEVDEARKVVNRVGAILLAAGIAVTVFHDDVSRTQRNNVNAIVAFHNRQQRDLDVSVHFNASKGGTRDAGIGVETLYRDGNAATRQLAGRISKSIADASGLILRHQWRDVPGTVPRADIGFLNNTTRPAVLVEVCFVNSVTDVRLYRDNFEAICRSIASDIVGRDLTATPPEPLPEQEPQPVQIWPISSKNMSRMEELGVIGSPDYWRRVKNEPRLDRLLSIAGEPGRLDRRIYNGIPDADIALRVLQDAGIIGDPDYWRNAINSAHVKRLDRLLIAIANRSRDVLERIIWAEARGEDLKGQILVGNVIRNRCKSDRFPDGIWQVVFQNGVNSQGVLVHQFTPVANGAYARAVTDKRNWQAVDHILSGVDHSQGATFFRSTRGLENSWHQQALRHLFTHGNHAFFIP